MAPFTSTEYHHTQIDIENKPNFKFFYNLKPYYLNKHIISLFYYIQQGFLPLFFSSKVGNKVLILTFYFVFIINKFIYN